VGQAVEIDSGLRHVVELYGEHAWQSRGERELIPKPLSRVEPMREGVRVREHRADLMYIHRDLLSVKPDHRHGEGGAILHVHFFAVLNTH